MKPPILFNTGYWTVVDVLYSYPYLPPNANISTANISHHDMRSWLKPDNGTLIIDLPDLCVVEGFREGRVIYHRIAVKT